MLCFCQAVQGCVHLYMSASVRAELLLVCGYMSVAVVWRRGACLIAEVIGLDACMVLHNPRFLHHSCSAHRHGKYVMVHDQTCLYTAAHAPYQDTKPATEIQAVRKPPELSTSPSQSD